MDNQSSNQFLVKGRALVREGLTTEEETIRISRRGVAEQQITGVQVSA